MSQTILRVKEDVVLCDQFTSMTLKKGEQFVLSGRQDPPPDEDQPESHEASNLIWVQRWYKNGRDPREFEIPRSIFE
jgi:hypothetical protein